MESDLLMISIVILMQLTL